MVKCFNCELYLPVEQTTATDLEDTVLVPKLKQAEDITYIIKNIRTEIHLPNILDSKPSKILIQILIKN